MIAVIQRVKRAKVIADGALSGSINAGLYILLGVALGDEERDATALAEKISKLRIFSDVNGKMNLSVNDVSGEVLGAQKAIEFAISKGYKEVTIAYDYQGIESWALCSRKSPRLFKWCVT